MMDGSSLNENFPAPAPAKGSSVLRILGMGCLISLLILFAIGFYISQNWRGWTAGFITQAVEQALKESLLPENEQTQIRVAVKKVITRFEAEELSTEQFTQLIQKFQEGPLFILTLFRGFEIQHIKSSLLDAAEKADAPLQFDRILRGWVERKIDLKKLEELILILPKDSDGNVKENLTDEEIRAFLKKVKDIADSFEIPNEPFTINIAEEIDKIIEQVLQPK